MRALSVLGMGTFIFASACGGSAASELASDEGALSSAAGHAVYTLSNDPAGNAVVALARSNDGTLSSLGSYATGGLGSGNGLGSQGAIVTDETGHIVVAVNAGSHQISSFRTTRSGLELASVVPSGGTRPISVTVHGGLAYALNAGGTPNISGFAIDARGVLTPIAGSTRTLSDAPATAPAQVAFTPDGSQLVVSEKASNRIDVYAVEHDGTVTGPVVSASSGATPFGFGFDERGHLIVSEAFGGAANGSAVSSYELGGDGTATTVSASVPTAQTAACWIAVSRNGRFAYAANAGSASVSGYAIAQDGTLARFDDGGVTGRTGRTPVDMTMSLDGRYLYVLDGGSDEISAFRVEEDGRLTAVPGASNLPSAGVGIAAR